MFTLSLILRHWRTCLDIICEMGLRAGLAQIAATVRAVKRAEGRE